MFDGVSCMSMSACERLSPYSRASAEGRAGPGPRGPRRQRAVGAPLRSVRADRACYILWFLFVGTEPTVPQTLASMEYLHIMQPNGIQKTFASFRFVISLIWYGVRLFLLEGPARPSVVFRLEQRGCDCLVMYSTHTIGLRTLFRTFSTGMTHSCTTKGDLLLKTIYILSLLLLRRPNLLYMLYVHITNRLSILYETHDLFMICIVSCIYFQWSTLLSRAITLYIYLPPRGSRPAGGAGRARSPGGAPAGRRCCSY